MGRAALLCPLTERVAVDPTDPELTALGIALILIQPDPVRGVSWVIFEGSNLPLWRAGDTPRIFRTLGLLMGFAREKQDAYAKVPDVRREALA